MTFTVHRIKSIPLVLILALASPLSFAQARGFRPGGQRNGPIARNPNPQHAQRPRGEWLRKYKEMPPAVQQRLLNNDPDFQKLPPERQQRLRQKLQQFNTLPPPQKEKIVQRMEAFDRLTPDQQQQARGLHAKMQNIPEDRRKMMRTALRSLRQMSPEQRTQVMNSDQFKGMFNDDERDVMRGLTELPIGQPQPLQPPTTEGSLIAPNLVMKAGSHSFVYLRGEIFKSKANHKDTKITQRKTICSIGFCSIVMRKGSWESHLCVPSYLSW